MVSLPAFCNGTESMVQVAGGNLQGNLHLGSYAFMAEVPGEISW